MKKLMYINKTKGQVMVITLLVLTILVIIVTSVIIVVQRDVEQRTNTELYERYLDNAESKVTNSINTFGSVRNTAITTVATQGGNNCGISGTVVTCNYTDTDPNKGNVKLTITDSKNLNAFPLQKDQTYYFLLPAIGGWNADIDFTWSGNASMLVTYVYTDASGVYRSVSDIYDAANLVQPSQSSTDALIFTPLPGNNGFRMNTSSSLVGITNIVPRYLALRPLMSTQGGEILLSSSSPNPSSLYQVRIYEGTGYAADVSTAFGESPAPTTTTQIPLAPSLPSIFGYVLLSQNRARN